MGLSSRKVLARQGTFFPERSALSDRRGSCGYIDEFFYECYNKWLLEALVSCATFG